MSSSDELGLDGSGGDESDGRDEYGLYNDPNEDSEESDGAGESDDDGGAAKAQNGFADAMGKIPVFLCKVRGRCRCRAHL